MQLLISMDADADYEDHTESMPVEPQSRRAANFIDDDEFEGEDVDLTQRPGKPQNPYMASAFGQGDNLPPLPANLQRMKNMFDMIQMQKEMVSCGDSRKD